MSKRTAAAGSEAKATGKGRGAEAGASPARARDPRIAKRARSPGGGGSSSRVPPAAGRSDHSADSPLTGEVIPAASSAGALPASPPSDEPSHYKGIPLHRVGRDSAGKVIPHRRSETVAQQIREWVAGGFDLNAIAVRLNVRPGLLKECYSVELAAGADHVGMDMTSHILKRAKESDRMAIFFAKARMNWRDGDGKPMDTGVLDIHIHL